MMPSLFLVLPTAAVLCTIPSHAEEQPGGGEPNPPKWPPSVRVFSPTDTDIKETVEAAFKINGGMCEGPGNEDCPPGQWSTHRFAFLFMPGRYSVDVPVGFYTTIAGLGHSPDDVSFTGLKGVFTEEGSSNFTLGALENFWRSGENFRNQATFQWPGAQQGMLWAVSQAAPLRRIHVDNDLTLYEYIPPWEFAGYASGGFLSNSKIGGTVHYGSQQQWCVCVRNGTPNREAHSVSHSVCPLNLVLVWAHRFTRNCEIDATDPLGGVFNMVWVGTKGAPHSHCNPAWSPNMEPYTVVDYTPVVAEKPFIVADRDVSTGRFALCVPPVTPNATQGVDWSVEPESLVPFEQVRCTALAAVMVLRSEPSAPIIGPTNLLGTFRCTWQSTRQTRRRRSTLNSPRVCTS